MAAFLPGDRDQPFLLPPDLRDWLPADQLAWSVADVVDQLDLAPFLAAYRADGHGHPAYDPTTLLGVLLHAYSTGVRSSRQIQQRCREALALRVLAGNQLPDHVTIARFRVRHEQALAGFLVQSLKLCAAAGLVRLGLVALDGTKVAATHPVHQERRSGWIPDEFRIGQRRPDPAGQGLLAAARSLQVSSGLCSPGPVAQAVRALP